MSSRPRSTSPKLVWGALNLFSTKPDAFDADDIETALAVASHAAVALASAVNIENLQAAMVNRSDIGMATGLVMATYDLKAIQAFGVLKRMSSEQNRKVAVLAREMIATCEATGSL